MQSVIKYGAFSGEHGMQKRIYIFFLYLDMPEKVKMKIKIVS
jgi:hypothetical protein